jgi:competence CoiA-like predicted nuclease
MAEACANRTHQRQDHYRSAGFEVQDILTMKPYLKRFTEYQNSLSRKFTANLILKALLLP